MTESTPKLSKEDLSMELLRPIKNESDYQVALNEIDALFDAAPNTPDQDRLDILCTLVDSYEKVHHPIEMPDPIEAIHYYVDARGLALEDLDKYFGDRATTTEVLSRRRFLTLEMIRHLSEGLGIPADILIQQYEPSRTSA